MSTSAPVLCKKKKAKTMSSFIKFYRETKKSPVAPLTSQQLSIISFFNFVTNLLFFFVNKTNNKEGKPTTTKRATQRHNNLLFYFHFIFHVKSLFKSTFCLGINHHHHAYAEWFLLYFEIKFFLSFLLFFVGLIKQNCCVVLYFVSQLRYAL